MPKRTRQRAAQEDEVEEDDTDWQIDKAEDDNEEEDDVRKDFTVLIGVHISTHTRERVKSK